VTDDFKLVNVTTADVVEVSRTKSWTACYDA